LLSQRCVHTGLWVGADGDASAEKDEQGKHAEEDEMGI
jgi:hypothetical protein